MGAAISGCRRRLAHWELDGIVEDRTKCSLPTPETISRSDILIACHNPNNPEHGRVYLMSHKKTLYPYDGKEYYMYSMLENPHYVDSKDDWNKYLGKKQKFKYVWGINCILNIPDIFSNIMQNAYKVLDNDGMLIFPIPVGFEVKDESYPPGWEKMFIKEIMSYKEMPVWLEVDYDKPRAIKFLIFTKQSSSYGGRRKTIRKRGRRRTQKTKR